MCVHEELYRLTITMGLYCRLVIPLAMAKGAITSKTRMVQLPATAAIEYVAACWVSGVGGIFVRGAYVLFPKFNAYTHRLGFLRLAS